MNNQERLVKWKCPECGNYHKWVWSIYDIFGGEITMTCDNPECGVKSKMYMIVEKGGNATAFVSAFNGNADNSQVEEKLRRATEKVMNSQTEVDISRVLIDGDKVTIMGVKYQRIIEPEPQTLKELFQIYVECGNWAQSKEVIAQELVNIVKEFIPEPVKYDGEEYQLGWNDAIQKIMKNLFK